MQGFLTTCFGIIHRPYNSYVALLPSSERGESELVNPGPWIILLSPVIGSFMCQALFQISCVERPSNSHAKQIQFRFPKAEKNEGLS